jgi:hypothetical protein
MASVDLSDPLYAAIKGNAPIASALAVYEGQPAIFTSRPSPIKSGFPLILAAGDVTYSDQDFIDAPFVVIVRDVAVYGLKQLDKTKDQYWIVEATARLVRDLFHRKRGSLIVPGWNVVDIRCAGPIVAPVDDDHTVGRIVPVTVRLSQ